MILAINTNEVCVEPIFDTETLHERFGVDPEKQGRDLIQELLEKIPKYLESAYPKAIMRDIQSFTIVTGYFATGIYESQDTAPYLRENRIIDFVHTFDKIWGDYYPDDPDKTRKLIDFMEVFYFRNKNWALLDFFDELPASDKDKMMNDFINRSPSGKKLLASLKKKLDKRNSYRKPARILGSYDDEVLQPRVVLKNIRTFIAEAAPTIYAKTIVGLREKFSQDECLVIVELCKNIIPIPRLAGSQLLVEIQEELDYGRDEMHGLSLRALQTKLRGRSVFDRACLEIWGRTYDPNNNKEE